MDEQLSIYILPPRSHEADHLIAPVVHLLLISLWTYAGTPRGVGPVKVGQKITAGITGLLDIHLSVEKRRELGSS